jgi:hypothetical protein
LFIEGRDEQIVAIIEFDPLRRMSAIDYETLNKVDALGSNNMLPRAALSMFGRMSRHWFHPTEPDELPHCESALPACFPASRRLD